MGWLREIKYMLLRLDRRRADLELDEEIQAHMAMEIQRNIEAGMSAAEARRRALSAFGSVSLAKEDSRAQWGFMALEMFWKDVLYAARLLAKEPGFSIVALLTLAIGTGASTTIFSVVNGVLLKPLPFNQPDRLVKLWIGKAPSSLSKAEFEEIKRNSQTLDDVAAYSGWSFTLTDSGQPAKLSGARTTATFFSVLGTRAALGRTFRLEEDQPDRSHVAILSHSLWASRFGSDRDIIGQEINIDGQSHTVVGVLPGGFNFPDNQFPKFDFDLAVPAPLDPNNHNDYTAGYLNVIGRLRPGIAREQARAELVTIARDARARLPKTPDNYGLEATVTPLQEEMVGDVRPMLLILLGAVGFVLLIACANVANLQLARRLARGREIAVRAALGASRGRVIRQLLTESILLSLLGGTAGVLWAVWGLKVLVSILPADLPRLNEIRMDGRVLGFTLAASMLTGLLFGIAPALHGSRFRPQDALRDGGRTSTAEAGGRMRGLLVIVETALAMMLVVGAGLMIKGFWRLRQVDPGFKADNVLSLRLAPAGRAFDDDSHKRAFYNRVLDRIQNLPGVRAAGGIHLLPMGGSNWNPGLRVEDQPQPAGEAQPAVDWRLIDSRYFEAMGIPLIKGRLFDERDNETAPGVAIVNETLARRYWPGQDPVGKRIRSGFEGKEWIPIVGVVGDVKEQGLDLATHLEMYRPYDQAPFTSSLTLMVAASMEPTALASAIRDEVWAEDKDVPVADIQPLAKVVTESVAARRSTMLMLAAFAVLALGLGALGIYGVMAYSVSQQTHEIGIRMALGAGAGDVLGMVIGRGMLLASAGVGIGLIGAACLTQLMSSLLFGVTATDPLIFAGVAVLMALAAMVACYVPSRRATRVDPVVALRCE